MILEGVNKDDVDQHFFPAETLSKLLPTTPYILLSKVAEPYLQKTRKKKRFIL